MAKLSSLPAETAPLPPPFPPSLLNTLARRLDSAVVLTGDLRLNGRDYERRTLKACSGYVMQARGRRVWGSGLLTRGLFFTLPWAGWLGRPLELKGGQGALL